METLKEIAYDVLVVLAGLLIVTAEGISTGAKGLSCGRVETSAQAHP